MVNPRRLARSVIFVLALAALSAASVSAAFGQFTITSNGLYPSAVDPGGSAIATLNLQPTPNSGFDSPVSLSCAVTPADADVNCAVSPPTQIPPANGPSLTVTTVGAAPGLYSILVTGTSGATVVTLSLDLTIVDVTQDYTLSALPTTASPSPISAGNVSTTTVTVSPIGSYSGNVTLACLSVSPVVAAAPYCSFTYPNGLSYAVVSAGTPASALLTITTFGPTPTTKLRTPRMLYALWLVVPGFTLAGLGGAGNRRKRILGLFLLLAVGSSLLLMPSCGSSNNTNNPTGQNTPNNSYVFTLTGADQNGTGPDNSTTSPATVSLVVN